MTTWRGLFSAALLVAAITAAGAATDSQDQGLDVPWEGIAVFDFFLDHPDFAATAGKILGIVKYRIVKERDGVFWGDDAHGATGTFDKRLLPTVQKTLVNRDL